MIAQYFNPAAFVQDKPGALGNAGKGIMEGPGIATVDFGAVKGFHIRERFQVQ